jgi:hypothetical protein
MERSLAVSRAAGTFLQVYCSERARKAAYSRLFR